MREQKDLMEERWWAGGEVEEEEEEEEAAAAAAAAVASVAERNNIAESARTEVRKREAMEAEEEVHQLKQKQPSALI